MTSRGWIAGVLVVMTLGGCDDTIFVPHSSEGVEGDGTLWGDAEALFSSDCAACHSVGGQSPELAGDDIHAGLVNVESGIYAGRQVVLHKTARVEASLEDSDRRKAVEAELADVVIYALQFADRGEIDLASAVRRKMRINAEKYPVERSRGSSRKYDA